MEESSVTSVEELSLYTEASLRNMQGNTETTVEKPSTKSVTIYQNFFDESLYHECNSLSKSDMKTNRFLFRTNLSWNENVVYDSALVLIYPLPRGDLFDRIAESIAFKIGKKVNTIQFYYWTPNSHIPWHNDKSYEGGLTIYLNDEWDINHGGLFLYEKGDDIMAIPPRPNQAILQLGGVKHAVSALTTKSPFRRTIQIFFMEN